MSSDTKTYPVYDTRTTTIKQSDDYLLGRIGMVNKWKVLSDTKLGLVINGYDVDIPFLDGVNFNMKEIREYLRSAIPDTPENNNLCIIEDILFGNQLLATEFYTSFHSEFLQDLIFTGDIRVRFKPLDKLEKIEIEEEYVLSDHQIKDRAETEEEEKKRIDRMLKRKIQTNDD